MEIPYIWPKNILSKFSRKLNIGFDPKLFTYSTLKRYFENNAILIPINKNIFAEKKNSFNKNNIFYSLNKNVTGESSESKINRLTKILKKKK